MGSGRKAVPRFQPGLGHRKGYVKQDALNCLAASEGWQREWTQQNCKLVESATTKQWQATDMHGGKSYKRERERERST